MRRPGTIAAMYYAPYPYFGVLGSVDVVMLACLVWIAGWFGECARRDREGE